MSDEIYHRLAQVLDTLPNGFPATESGVELRLLRKVFTPEEADLFCDLKLSFENAEEIARRTGRPLEGLDQKLQSMWQRGELFSVDLGEARYYKMMPWAFGIYEFQLPRMDREFCELCEEYSKTYGKQFFANKPQLMQVVPVEKEIPGGHQALPYEQVSSIIENGKSFRLTECICKKEMLLLDQGCKKPLECCLAVAPVPGAFEQGGYGGRVVSREEAYALLAKAEENALVHLTWNAQVGQMFICNCCGCCCGVLRSINELKIPAGQVVNSHYYARIDPEVCTACGTCAEERCQVKAIEEGEESYRVIRERCIGCGLCVSTCPSGAMELVRKDEEEIETPPFNEDAWFEERGRRRGVDFSRYK
jgi:Na+-translocating ferredoxin:NAD+ oxidoreductase subunit B